MDFTVEDRRANPRTAALADSGLSHARMQPGRTARVVNLSAGGALIETDWRLLPGARVELQLGAARRLRVTGRIVYCHVETLNREGVRYRGGLAFEEQLPIGEVATPHRGGYLLSQLLDDTAFGDEHELPLNGRAPASRDRNR